MRKMERVTKAEIISKSTDSFGTKKLVIQYTGETFMGKTYSVVRDLYFNEGEWVEEETLIKNILKHGLYAY